MLINLAVNARTNPNLVSVTFVFIIMFLYFDFVGLFAVTEGNA